MDKHSSWAAPKHNRTYYGLTIMSFGFGLIFGILAGYLLDAARFQTLYQYLAGYFQTNFPQSSSQAIYQALIQANGLDLAKLLFLGFCLIGAPLIILQLFIKGFSLGFTLSLFLKGLAAQQAIAGFTMLLLAQIVPALLIIASGAYALQSSWTLLMGQSLTNRGYWLRYLLYCVLFLLAAIAASCLEGFLLHSVFADFLSHLFVPNK